MSVSYSKTSLYMVLAIVLFFCFAECAAGSCLNYGHACWGAHGKRSGVQNPTATKAPTNILKSRWFLSKLIESPLDLPYSQEENVDMSRKHNTVPFFVESDVDDLNGPEEWDENQGLILHHQLVGDSSGPSSDSRIRLAKFLDKRSIKHE